MDENARRRKRPIAEIVALAAFFAVLLAMPWVVYVASIAILRLQPGAAPDTFAVVYRTRNDGYAVTDWRGYPVRGAQNGFKTFRLPEAAGYLDGPKLQFSFRVLEDDGSRQVVEVRTTGLIRAVSRYAAHADRIVPISYRGLLWGYHYGVVPQAMITFGLALLVAWSAFAAAGRLTRLQQTC